MTWRVVSQPTDEMIRNTLGIKKGSGRPHDEKVAKLTKAQVEQIAAEKIKYMNTSDLESAIKQVAGTARSMGVEIEQ
jgi:large subunit ribosomal protein L11